MATLKVKLAIEIESLKKGTLVRKMLTELLEDWGKPVNVVTVSGSNRNTKNNDKSFDIENILRKLNVRFEKGNSSISGRAIYGKTIKIISKSK